MRTVITGGGIVVLVMLMLFIQSSVISRNMRDNEVDSGLESAADYALDCMEEVYRQMDYDESQTEAYITQLINVFCTALDEMISTDGDITVSVVRADLETGTFDLIVEESYSYGFRGRKGKSCCERAVTFSS